MDGVLVVDKPAGMTSHDVVAAARRWLGERRIGHTGTLDPMATGVLALACGRATRLVRFLTASSKEYEAEIRFGVTTDTWDATGVEVARSDLRPRRENVETALASLRGDYLQAPPVFSAKKVAGRRAYDLARRDRPVTLAPVPVRVSRADLTAFDWPSARVSIVCSAGFYVRSFAHELGQRVGCGAHLAALRRRRSGQFSLAGALSLEALATSGPGAEGTLVPLDALLPDVPAARLTPEGRTRVSHGQAVGPAHLTATPGRGTSEDAALGDRDGQQAWVRLLDDAGHLVALARPGETAGVLHPAVVLT